MFEGMLGLSFKIGGLGDHPNEIFQKLTPISCNLRHSVIVFMTLSKLFPLYNSMSKFLIIAYPGLTHGIPNLSPEKLPIDVFCCQNHGIVATKQ